MINEKNVTNDESLKKFTNTAVVIKLKTGRVISGTLREEDNHFTLKLGVLHLPIEASKISRITSQELLTQL